MIIKLVNGESLLIEVEGKPKEYLEIRCDHFKLDYGE